MFAFVYFDHYMLLLCFIAIFVESCKSRFFAFLYTASLLHFCRISCFYWKINLIQFELVFFLLFVIYTTFDRAHSASCRLA